MSLTILVVDDDNAIVRGVAVLLEQAGYTVITATTGPQAIARLSASPAPALVILDVVLPECDGYEVCRYIQHLSTHIPVLMVSARDEVMDKVHGLDIGAADYLTKPFEPCELIARVRSLLRFKARATGQAPSDLPLVVGPVVMWLTAHRVEVNGQEINLPPKEWALLELFLRHPNTVFGRETLLRHIWGYDFVGDSRTVDVHIQRLRSHLEGYSVEPFIQTVRGFGYRLILPASIPLATHAAA